MTKQEFDSKFAGENTVVNCKTEELARKFLDKATKYGNKNWLIDDEVVVEFNGFESEYQ